MSVQCISMQGCGQPSSSTTTLCFSTATLAPIFTKLRKYAIGSYLRHCGLYFDEALQHGASLVMAYETVAEIEPQRSDEQEAWLFYFLQAQIVYSILNSCG